MLILVFDLEATHVSDGTVSRPHVFLEASDIRRAVRNSGFTDVNDDVCLVKSNEGLQWDGTGYIYLTARKCSE